MKKKVFLCLAALAFFLAGCSSGRSKSEVKKDLSAKLDRLRSESDGYKATAIREEITAGASKNNLTLQDIGTSSVVLDKMVQEAFARNAKRLIAELREVRNDPQKAEKLAGEFYQVQQRSGLNIEQYGIPPNWPTHAVFQNYFERVVELAASRNITPSLEDYKTAGLTPPATAVISEERITIKPAKPQAKKRTVPVPSPAIPERKAVSPCCNCGPAVKCIPGVYYPDSNSPCYSGNPPRN
ncbi:MAG: hypothetical protein M1383_00825 [Patescibacteria group bacterium]|nr:hypothetical protein [Patescibacteria group bacterium]